MNKENFIDIFDYISINSIKIEDKKILYGQSIIKVYKLLDNELDILKQKNLLIDDIIIKKEIDYTKKNKACYLKTGGIDAQMSREIECLKILYKKKFFPMLLSISKNCIYMSYCGESITEKNIPSNWKEQLRIIIKTLNDNNIYHNDMWQYNFVVKNNIIHLIDFGYSKKNEDYPFINISETDLELFDDIFKLLTHVSTRVIQKRKIYRI